MTFEDDRAFVYAEVCQVMKETKVVMDDASEEDCLDAFNGCVRTGIRGMVQRKIGRSSIPYRKAVVAGTPGMWFGIDIVAYRVFYDPAEAGFSVMKPLDYMGEFMVWLTITLFVIPFLIGILVPISARCKTSLRKFFASAFVSLMACGVIAVVSEIGTTARREESWVMLAVSIILAAVLGVMNWVLYHGQCMQLFGMYHAEEPKPSAAERAECKSVLQFLTATVEHKFRLAPFATVLPTPPLVPRW